MPAKQSPSELDRVLFGGALDEHLRVRVATRGAEEVLGSPIPVGVSAASLLCGDRPKRPFAEALAAGVAFHAIIPRPGTPDEQIRVRSVPIGRGWLVYLADV